MSSLRGRLLRIPGVTFGVAEERDDGEAQRLGKRVGLWQFTSRPDPCTNLQETSLIRVRYGEMHRTALFTCRNGLNIELLLIYPY